MANKRPSKEQVYKTIPSKGPKTPKTLTEAQVNAAYQKILGRDVDPAGVKAHVGVKEVKSVGQMEQILLNSREYANKNKPRSTRQTSTTRGPATTQTSTTTDSTPLPPPPRVRQSAQGATASAGSSRYSAGVGGGENRDVVEARQAMQASEAKQKQTNPRRFRSQRELLSHLTHNRTPYFRGREIYQTGVGNQPATVVSGRAQADSEPQVQARASDLAEELRRNREAQRLARMSGG